MGISVEIHKVALSSTASVSNWNLEVLVFEKGEKKNRRPGEKTLGVRTITNNKLNQHVALSPGIEPRLHWWEVSAHNTAPSPLPRNQSLGKFKIAI